MLSKRTEELLSLDRRHIIHAGSIVGQSDVGPIIEKAEGITLQDTDGKEYIDCSSQVTSVSLGHGQKEIIDAICEQTKRLQFVQNWGPSSNLAMIECAQKLAEITYEGLDRFHFTGGGSEAIDAAIKMARLYWYYQGKSNYKIISLYNCYHGTTFGSVSATSSGRGEWWPGIGPLSSGFVHIPPYYCYRCPLHLEYPSCDIRCARYLEEIIQSEGADSVAAFLAEPVLGNGGWISPPPEYWPIVRKICTDYKVLLIADEIITGFGRTGKMFALQNWNVKPDILVLAKGIVSCYLPFGAVAINKPVYQGLKGYPFMHGVTHSGNPICAAGAIAVINILVRDKIPQHVAKVGQYALERLNTQFKPLPNVGDINGLGLLIGIELVKDKATKTPLDAVAMQKWHQDALQKGLSFRCRLAPFTRINFSPPLIITRDEVDEILDILYPLIAGLGQNSGGKMKKAHGE